MPFAFIMPEIVNLAAVARPEKYNSINYKDDRCKLANT